MLETTADELGLPSTLCVTSLVDVDICRSQDGAGGNYCAFRECGVDKSGLMREVRRVNESSRDMAVLQPRLRHYCGANFMTAVSGYGSGGDR
jgi:hypothetical protein